MPWEFGATNMLLVLPIAVPFVTAVMLLLTLRRSAWQRGLSLAGSTALLIVAAALLYRVWEGEIVTMQLAGLRAPFGITFVADLLSAVMVALTALIGCAAVVYSFADTDSSRERHGHYPLVQFLLMGVCGSFLTGDVFNLYVWFEVMLIASFVLMCLGGERAQLEGSIKYVTLNLLSSAIFLAAVGIAYGLVGTLNMADLARQLQSSSRTAVVNTLAVLFLIAFGIKAAVFPLFFWLPASYHTPPVAVSALFAGLLTKVGVYALIRFFTLLFTHDTPFTHNLILIIAGLTMITGVLGAAAQIEFRRILSFHIVSQIGFMVLGLGLFTPLALTGSIFYIIHHIIVKTNLFLISGVVASRMGSFQLASLGGLYARAPMLSILFLIPALSLSGIPPLSGFWAKFMLVKAGLEIGQFLIVAVALVVGLLTLFSMTKIWNEAFWKAPNDGKLDHKELPIDAGRNWELLAPIVVLSGLTLLLGLAGEPVYAMAARAANQLLDSSQYMRAVLGSEP